MGAIRFFGTVGRDKELSEFLGMLDRTGLVELSMDGEVLVIASAK